MSDFYKIKLVRSARKEHVCYLCGEKIEKGESYRQYVGNSNGEFCECKLHMDCYQMVEAYCSEAGLNSDEGWDEESVMTFIHEWLIDDGYYPEYMKPREAIKKWFELYGHR